MKTDQQRLAEFLHADSVIDEMKVIQTIRREQHEATMKKVAYEVDWVDFESPDGTWSIPFEDTQD